MRWLGLLWLVALSGCTLLPTTPAPAVRPVQPEAAPFVLNGRIAIRAAGANHSAGLHWLHRPHADEVLLLAPLGQTVARVYRDAAGATLDTGDRHYQARDAEALMQQVLGWHFPLDGLHYWVLGMAAPDSAAQVERDASGRVALLRQDGWEVQYQRYADDRADSLPTRLQLTRGTLQVRLLIDEWEWNPQ